MPILPRPGDVREGGEVTLPLDIARCHDSKCPEREECLRWLERESGEVHIDSLSQEPVCRCPEKISKEANSE